MKKLRYILPSLLILLAVFAIAYGATTLQSWSSTSGTVLAIDSNGSVNISGGLTTLTPSSGTAGNLTGGTLTYCEPFAGSDYKKIIVAATSLTSSAATTLTWSTSFATTPTLEASSMLAPTSTGAFTYGLTTSGTGATFTASATGGTLTASNSAASGFIILQGN